MFGEPKQNCLTVLSCCRIYCKRGNHRKTNKKCSDNVAATNTATCPHHVLNVDLLVCSLGLKHAKEQQTPPCSGPAVTEHRLSFKCCLKWTLTADLLDDSLRTSRSVAVFLFGSELWGSRVTDSEWEQFSYWSTKEFSQAFFCLF